MTYRYRHGDRPLEGYTIRRGIGRGGFGEVYYAISDGGREVALKVVQQNHDIELRGINHCINLKNPHLVSIFDVKSNAAGTPVVIMEYVAGPSLRDLLRDAPKGLGVQKAVFLVREIAKGLSYLHERGIVHRDLKPENIFYEDGYVKIGDYGLSKYISVSRQSGQTISVGTVHYMAPEIGSGNYSHGIDVYALGIILYELLTGSVPFDGDSMGEILMKHLTCEPDLSLVDEGFRPIISKALEKRPEDRYASVRDMVDALMQTGDVAEQVAAFNPASLTVVPRNPTAGTPTIDVQPPRGSGPASPPRAAGRPYRPAPPPLPAARSPTPRGRSAGSEQPAAAALPAPGHHARDIEQRLVHAAVTVLAMAFAVSLFTGSKSALWTNSLVIAGLAAVVCFVECWWVPRIRLDPGMGRRLLSFGLGIPVLVLAQGLFDLHEGAMYLLMAGMVCIDWSQRTHPARKERVSFGLAFSAALFGLIASPFVAFHPIGGAGLLAAVSLTVGAMAPFGPGSRSRGGRRHGHRGRRPGPAPQPAPPRPLPVAAAAPEPPPPRTESAGEGDDPEPAGRGSRLTRSRTDAMLGGVCGGLAQHYGWEVVWLRVAFLLATLLGFGAGILIYFVLWICMPEQPRPQRRFLAGSEAGPGAARITLGILLLVGAGVLAFMGIFAAFVEEIPPFKGSPSEHFLGGILFFGLAGASLFTALFCFRRRRTPGQIARTSRGWTALGALFLTLAFLLVALGTGRLITFEAGFDVLRLPDVDRFVRGGGHFALGFLFFLPGVCFVLLGRRDGGAGHVIRGALGWTLVALLVFFIARLAPSFVRLGAGGQIQGFRAPPIGWIELLTLLVVGMAGVIAVAWPQSTDRTREGGFVLEDPGGAGLPKSPAPSENTL